jgi:hypothetical protein
MIYFVDIPIVVSIISAVSTIGTGIGWFLDRKAKQKELELLNKKVEIANDESKISNADKINEIYNKLLHDIDLGEEYRRSFFKYQKMFAERNLMNFIKFVVEIREKEKTQENENSNSCIDILSC